MLVASQNHVEHRNHLKAVLQRLQHHGLVLNREKCVFSAPGVEYLGHWVSAEGIRPLAARVSAILNFHSPAHMVIYNVS